MPNWKKVLLSGSKASVYDITASNLPGESSATDDVVTLDSNGRFQTASRGDFGGGASGPDMAVQFAYTTDGGSSFLLSGSNNLLFDEVNTELIISASEEGSINIGRDGGISSGNTLGNLNFIGTGSAVIQGPSATIQAVAVQNFDANTKGAKLEFYTADDQDTDLGIPKLTISGSIISSSVTTKVPILLTNIISSSSPSQISAGTPNYLNLDDDRAEGNNSVTLASVNSVDLIIDSNNTDTTGEFRISHGNTSPFSSTRLFSISQGGHITASGNISSSKNVIANGVTSSLLTVATTASIDGLSISNHKIKDSNNNFAFVDIEGDIEMSSPSDINVYIDGNNNTSGDKFTIFSDGTTATTARPIVVVQDSGSIFTSGSITGSGISASGAIIGSSLTTNLISSSAAPTHSYINLDDDRANTNFVTLASIHGVDVLLDTNVNDTSGHFRIKHGSANPDTATQIFSVDQNGHISSSGNITASSAQFVDLVTADAGNNSLNIVTVTSDGNLKCSNLSPSDVDDTIPTAGTGLTGTSTFDLALSEVSNPSFGLVADSTNVLKLAETASLSRSGIGGADKLIIGGSTAADYKNIEYVTKDYDNTNLGHVFKVGSVTHLALHEVSTARKVSINPDGNDVDFQIFGNSKTDPSFYFEGSTSRVGVGDRASTTPNVLNIWHDGTDGNDGLMIIKDDTSISSGEYLGGIGFDARDGNVPSSVTESSVYIAAYANEPHSDQDKGGRLEIGVSQLNDNQDTVGVGVLSVEKDNTIIDAGKVGINNTAPSYAFDVLGNSGAYIARFRNKADSNSDGVITTTADGIIIRVDGDPGTTINRNYILFQNGTTSCGSIRSTGNTDTPGVDLIETSDERLKTNIEDLNNGLDTLLKIKPREFNWKNDNNADKSHGFIAQELYEIYPEAVSKPRSSEDNPEEDPWSVSKIALIPLLVSSIQDQQKMIEDLQQEIKTLKSQI
tara:strand:- start:12921 stop:15803 length:2883 start_codon:yes stop_codon:yes gene_type:complete